MKEHGFLGPRRLVFPLQCSGSARKVSHLLEIRVGAFPANFGFRIHRGKEGGGEMMWQGETALIFFLTSQSAEPNLQVQLREASQRPICGSPRPYNLTTSREASHGRKGTTALPDLKSCQTEQRLLSPCGGSKVTRKISTS